MLPKSSQLEPRSPNRAQLVAKIVQDRPEEPPNRPAKIPKCSQNVVVLFVFTLSPILQRSLPRPLKIDKTALQVASGRPSRAELGPSWLQLGAILHHLAEILGDLRLPKIGQGSLQENFHAKIASKTSQTPSRPRFSCFDTCLDSFFKDCIERFGV